MSRGQAARGVDERHAATMNGPAAYASMRPTADWPHVSRTIGALPDAARATRSRASSTRVRRRPRRTLDEGEVAPDRSDDAARCLKNGDSALIAAIYCFGDSLRPLGRVPIRVRSARTRAEQRKNGDSALIAAICCFGDSLRPLGRVRIRVRSARTRAEQRTSPGDASVTVSLRQYRIRAMSALSPKCSPS
jgi:hypothetical protein